MKKLIKKINYLNNILSNKKDYVVLYDIYNNYSTLIESLDYNIKVSNKEILKIIDNKKLKLLVKNTFNKNLNKNLINTFIRDIKEIIKNL